MSTPWFAKYPHGNWSRCVENYVDLLVADSKTDEEILVLVKTCEPSWGWDRETMFFLAKYIPISRKIFLEKSNYRHSGGDHDQFI